MNNIPEFPNAREIYLEDKPLFDEAFAKYPQEHSTYTFTNLFGWREGHNWKLSQVNNSLVVAGSYMDITIPLEPIGIDDKAGVINKCCDLAYGLKMEFHRLSEQTVEPFRNNDKFSVERERENDDYIYSSTDLIDLPGRQFDGKRNHLKRITKFEYQKITPETAMLCFNFAEKWCKDRICDTSEGLMHERLAINEMLINFEKLKLVGGMILIDGEIKAFSLGELLNPETLVVHIEKAVSGIDGLYQLINNEFCKHEAQNVKYVNREQDLGIPGLRKSKKSYHPVKMIQSYRIKCL